MPSYLNISDERLDSDFEKLMDDDLIGTGTTRLVYAAKNDPDRVIKVQKTNWPHSNMTEWIIWTAVKKMARDDILGHTPFDEFKKIFAECYSISESGKYLIMERLQPLTKEDYCKIPKVPDWFNDNKPTAFGIDNSGNVKILDYGVIDFYAGLRRDTHSVSWDKNIENG